MINESEPASRKPEAAVGGVKRKGIFQRTNNLVKMFMPSLNSVEKERISALELQKMKSTSNRLI